MPAHRVALVALLSSLAAVAPLAPAGAADLVSAILPTSRSVAVGQVATAFASLINVSGRTLSNCRPQLGTQIAATFTYQTTNSSTNALTGSPNTPVTLTSGKLQTFVLAITSQQAVDPVQLAILFVCDTAVSPAPTPNLDMLLFSASAVQNADVIALGSTVGNTGIVDIPGTGGAAAFALAASNVGATRRLTVVPDTPGVALPISLAICRTAANGTCLAPAGPSVTLDVASNATPSFAVFVGGRPDRDVPFDPTLNRITVSFTEGGVVRGSTSVAVRTVGGTAPPPPAEPVSPATLLLTGGSTTTFNALSTVVKLAMVGAALLPSASEVFAFNNGTPVATSSVSVSGSQISLTGVLQSGRNRLEVIALDQGRSATRGDFTLWAGSNQSVITVRNAQGVAQANVRVRSALSDDPAVFTESATNSSGQVTLAMLPANPIELRATSSDNTLVGYTTIQGSDSTGTVVVAAMNAPSTIDNNTFTQGLDGWNVGTAPVSLVPHTQTSALSVEAVPPTDQDLVISTAGEGPQTVTRTFTYTSFGESFFRVKFVFATSEVPGGYCGTQFNDRFSVTIRRRRGAVTDVPVLYSASMNQLGCKNFDQVTGSLKEPIELTVLTQTGDILEFEFVVVNVGDGAFDSRLIVEGILSGRFAIEDMALLDLDNTPLRFLSADPNNPYFGGHTIVNGTIRLKGTPGEKINDVFLEIIQGGQLVALAQLDPSAAARLINATFPADGIVAIAQSSPLFRLTNASAAGIKTDVNGTVRLRVRATTQVFDETTREYGREVKLLKLYKGAPHYFCCNEADGGDGWIQPNAVAMVQAVHPLFGIGVGDISKMNGGKFSPHKQHREGLEADFDSTDLDTAEKAVALITKVLNSAAGGSIRTIFFKYPTPDFGAALNLVTIGGRSLDQIVVNDSEHKGHVHIWFKE